jgi:hypothetical protein
MTVKSYRKEILAFIFLTGFTVIALKFGFSTIPSASVEQSIIADHQRVVDLGELQSSIDSFFQTNGELPTTLTILTPDTDSPNTSLKKYDPMTNKEYVYQIINGSAGIYKLCATFYQKSLNSDSNSNSDTFAVSSYDSYADQFTHPAGYYCFNESIGESLPTDAQYPSIIPDQSNDYPDVSGIPPTPAPLPSLDQVQADAKRTQDVEAILDAIDQYTQANSGDLPSELQGIPANMELGIKSTQFSSLCNQLVPKYISALPVDPIINNGKPVTACANPWNTGYLVSKDANNTITIYAPFTQEGETNISRKLQ